MNYTWNIKMNLIFSGIQHHPPGLSRNHPPGGKHAFERKVMSLKLVY